jgi:hypothetical protein
MWWTRRRVKIVCVAGAVAIATFLVLVLFPVPQHFVMRGAAIYDPNTSCAVGYPDTIDTTPGTIVNFRWSAPSSIIFFVQQCGSLSPGPFEGNGTSGSGSFLAIGGVYQFGASCPEGPCVAADVSGSYTGPLLAL